MRRVIRWTLVAATATLITPNHAIAAKYDVYGCHAPSGQAVGLDGWTPLGSPAGVVYNACGTRGVFGAAMVLGTAQPNSSVRWTFDAPDGTSISDIALYRSAHSASGRDWTKGYGLYYDSVDFEQSHVGETCYAWTGCGALGAYPGGLTPANLMAQSGLSARRAIAVLHCFGDGTNCGYSATQARFDIYRSRIGLSDPSAPVFIDDPRGPLFSAAPVNGVRTASFAATDRGGGLYRVGLDVDGVVRGSQSVQPGVTTCRRPVTHPVPCPLAASGTFSFDTSAFPDGTHSVRLALSDIAGNTTYSRPKTVTFHNHSRPNGLGASRDVRLSAGFGRHRARHRVSRFGARPVVTGRLRRGDGFPIPGASIRILGRTARADSRYRVVGRARTDAGGRFRYRLPQGPSRRLRVGYRAFDLDAADAASRDLALDVHAGVTLVIHPRLVRNGHQIIFRGQLRGGPARRGALITLQETSPRPLTFMTIHAHRQGRFHATYRFRYTYRRSLFGFRALVQRQAGYPYLGGRSRTLPVVVMP